MIRLTLSILVGLLLTLSQPLLGAVELSSAPLNVNPPVVPALILAVDNSGSMDAEILLRSNDGAAWWHTGDDSFSGRDMNDNWVAGGGVNFNRAGSASSTWKKFIYLFPNGTGLTSGRRAYGDSSNDHFAVPPIGAYGYVRSHQYNNSYFNPFSLYTPWPSLGGYTFGDSDPTAAKTDPTRGSETLNLTVNIESNESNHRFRFYPTMRLPFGVRYRDWSDGNWKSVTAMGGIEPGDRQLAVSYYPATFYLTEDQSLPADFGYLPERSVVEGVIGAEALRDGATPDGAAMIRYEIRAENFISADHYQRAIQNFANWFTYYRKRHAAARGAIGAAFADIDGFRVGAYTINSRPNPASDLLIRDLAIGAEREAFFYQIYRNFIGKGGTPNREAVNAMRAQFSRTDANAPIQQQCQMNFGLLFTDGYANVWTGSGVGNRDGAMGSPFADSQSNTLADIGAALYLDNPRPDLPTGRVPTPSACSGADPDPALDCNSNLHVNLFALTMGTVGTIFKVDLLATADPFANPPNWPTHFSTRNPVHVDDLWHATINSRGMMVDAEVPQELGERFREILNEIAARLDSGATSAAASSAVLQSDTLLYTAGFRSGDWSGTLKARRIYANGSLSSESCDDGCWDAEEQLRLKGAHFRNLVAGIGGGAAVSLQFDQLTAAQQQVLNHHSDNSNDGLGAARVAWLRGVEHGSLRSRSDSGQLRLLGDIVHSDPQYRHDILYVGANDGMVHAFDASSGEELFGYIPTPLLLPEAGRNHAPLSRLTDPNYAHSYFMDGTLTVVDVSLGGSAKTILVGGMGAGGRTLFALDVTDPANFSANDVMWEFSHAELGYNSGAPAVVRTSSGTWAAIVGNGYNSDSGKASLFVIDLASGNLIKRIGTDNQLNNGLATPFVTDWAVNNLRAARVYAGDLFGRLWSFDLSSTNTSHWTQSSRRKILFTATDSGGSPQPITSAPYGAQVNSDEAVIAFGSGSYFRASDGSDHQTQSIYGILDHIDFSQESELARDQLLQQSILHRTTVTAVDGSERILRILSDLAFNPAIHKGWYLDMGGVADLGERVINGPRTLGREERRVRFTSLVPDSDPCGTGQRGFLIDVNLLTGGRAEAPVFDLNEDQKFDDNDTIELIVDGEPEKIAPSSIDFGGGELPITIRVADPLSDDYELICDGEGNCEFTRPSDATLTGRQSWQQLR
ncbi:hypothetical protein D5085_09515 [Ectothiorhodospiraceae bacterium BW-2]|nr:hypothetical protein D5085_09515 [Ectothiorhodospiraceae bacterium BW-2]